MAEYWSNVDRDYKIRLQVNQVSQDIASNSSRVSIRLDLFTGWTGFTMYDCVAWVDYDGKRLNWSGRPDMSAYNSSLNLINTTVTINHNNDGGKSFNISAHFNGSGGWSPGNLDIGSKGFGLTTIPRASNISIGSAIIGGTMAINISRQSTSFTHTLRYRWGNLSGTIASGVATNYIWSLPASLAKEIPNSDRGSGTIFVDTYSGGTRTGTQSVAFTAIVGDTIKPTISSLTLLDTQEKTRTVLGANNFLQNFSNIQVTCNGASGIHGSSIKGYQIEIVNKKQSINENGGKLGTMNFTGSATVRARVVDSRNKWSDPKDVTINVIAYHVPAIQFQAIRTRADPSKVQVIRNVQVSPVTVGGRQINKLVLEFKVGTIGSENYVSDTGPASGTYTSTLSLVNSAANLSGTYGGDRAFNILGIASDLFTSSPTLVALSGEAVVMSYDKDGRIGAGKVADTGLLPGSIDAKGQVRALSGEFSTLTTQGITVGTNGVPGTVTTTNLYADHFYMGNVHIVNRFFPVGAIYITADDKNPATFLGGTWERFGTGRTLVGFSENEDEFNTAGKMGGSKTHKLTVDEMPKHTHGQVVSAQNGSLNVRNDYSSEQRGNKYPQGITTDPAGGDLPHNNLQPYITVFFWKRTK